MEADDRSDFSVVLILRQLLLLLHRRGHKKEATEPFHAGRVSLTDNSGINVASIDFPSRLQLMTFKSQCL